MEIINILSALLIGAVVWIYKEVYSMRTQLTSLTSKVDAQEKKHDESAVEFKDLKKEMQSLRESIITLNITLQTMQSKTRD